jgi:hypothetical protein
MYRNVVCAVDKATIIANTTTNTNIIFVACWCVSIEKKT